MKKYEEQLRNPLQSHHCFDSYSCQHISHILSPPIHQEQLRNIICALVRRRQRQCIRWRSLMWAMSTYNLLYTLIISYHLLSSPIMVSTPTFAILCPRIPHPLTTKSNWGTPCALGGGGGGGRGTNPAPPAASVAQTLPIGPFIQFLRSPAARKSRFDMIWHGLTILDAYWSWLIHNIPTNPNHSKPFQTHLKNLETANELWQINQNISNAF